MIVQWCLKGIGKNGFGRSEALEIIRDKGIESNWSRGRDIKTSDIKDQLTEDALDKHIHDYASFGAISPFISLTAGSIERDVDQQVNHVHSAWLTASAFATDWGELDVGYVFVVVVLVGANKLVPIAGVAEEIRNLNLYQEWSEFNLEGEVTAKIFIPPCQIHSVYEVTYRDMGGSSVLESKPVALNANFIKSVRLSNIREIV